METGIPRGAIANNGIPRQDTAFEKIGIPIIKHETAKEEINGIYTGKIKRKMGFLNQETARMLETGIPN